jgi:hypothetical protein
LASKYNGYECLDCNEVERDGSWFEGDDCNACGGGNAQPRIITDCDDRSCRATTHDFGANWHVEQPAA